MNDGQARDLMRQIEAYYRIDRERGGLTPAQATDLRRLCSLLTPYAMRDLNQPGDDDLRLPPIKRRPR